MKRMICILLAAVMFVPACTAWAEKDRKSLIVYDASENLAKEWSEMLGLEQPPIEFDTTESVMELVKGDSAPDICGYDFFALKEAGMVAAFEPTELMKEDMAEHQEAEPMTSEQKEDMRARIGIVQHRQLEITETLLPQHIADQIEQRTDEKAAQEAFQLNGYLPLYVDEKTMGIVYNTLTMQLLLDRFNLIFEGVFEPMDQGTVTSIMSNVLAPYWKQHGQSILFTLEEAADKTAAKE